MKLKLQEICSDAKSDLVNIDNLEKIEELRLKYLGKKGVLNLVLRDLVNVSAQERPEIGKLANDLKCELTDKIEQRKEELKKEEIKRSLENDVIDITLPGCNFPIGGLHPLTQIEKQIVDVFAGLGFEEVEGPEIETEYYNFEGLNIPTDHASRDMWDSFYIKEGVLLRSHTSPVQIRVMEKRKPPFRIVSCGKCYRRDAIDATHSWMFNQLEGFMIDEGVTMGDLKGVLDVVAREIYGKERKTRFVPSYFPFTEPSAEMLVDCFVCNGKGCSMCKGSGWIEILGAGMIHPAIIERSGYDKEKYTGFAFGMGLERTAMLKYGINDIRLFFENDKRFLMQF